MGLVEKRGAAGVVSFELLYSIKTSFCSIPPDSLIHQIWTWVLFIFKDALRRVSSWLGVFLALIRYLVIKFGTKTWIKVLMKPETSWKLFFSTFFFSLVVTMINQGRYTIMEYKKGWKPDER